MSTVLLQLLVSGLAMGFIYALVGIEYTFDMEFYRSAEFQS